MEILKASWLITSDTKGTIIQNGAVVYDEKIIDVDSVENIKERYPTITIKDLGETSVLILGLINSHIHLEFSANKTILKYGNFMDWLHSVIASRDELIQEADTAFLQEELKHVLRTGTTTIGAISSYGFDLEACLNSKLNVVYFNEAIGSKPEMIDSLFDDFKARLNASIKSKEKTFILQ